MADDSTYRRHTRQMLNVTFRVRDSDDPVGGELLFDSLDLSIGGAFLRSDLLLEQGERVRVRFELPGRPTPVIAQARVARVTRTGDDPGMGLEFLDLTDEERAAIDAFIRGQRRQALRRKR